MIGGSAHDVLDLLRRPQALEALSAHLQRQRWYAGRGRAAGELRVVDAVPVRETGELSVWSLLVSLGRPGGGDDLYHLVLSRRPQAEGPAADDADPRVIAVDAGAGEPALLVDALADGGAMAELWEALRTSATLRGRAGTLRCANLRMPEPSPGEEPVIRPLGRDQSNSSAVRGDTELLKILRRVAPGVSPELEITDALARAGFTHTPAPLASAEYVPDGGGEPVLLAVAQPFLHNATEGWSMALTSLRGLYADLEESLVPAPGTAPGRLAPDADAVGLASTFAAEATRLGRVTAEMHLALLEAGPDEALRARPTTAEELDGWASEMVAELDGLLARDDDALSPLRARRPELVAAFAAVRALESPGTSIRVHGDYHLGQTLRTDDGWTILDFEGEPDIPLAARRRRSSALRDVGGMLRSFDYAAAAALAERVDPADPDWVHLQPLGDAWALANREAFWSAYESTVAGTRLLPEGEGTRTMLRAHELRKAVYETGYELGHRPTWVGIPLRFLLSGGPP